MDTISEFVSSLETAYDIIERATVSLDQAEGLGGDTEVNASKALEAIADMYEAEKDEAHEGGVGGGEFPRSARLELHLRVRRHRADRSSD